MDWEKPLNLRQTEAGTELVPNKSGKKLYSETGQLRCQFIIERDEDSGECIAKLMTARGTPTPIIISLPSLQRADVYQRISSYLDQLHTDILT